MLRSTLKRTPSTPSLLSETAFAQGLLISPLSPSPPPPQTPLSESVLPPSARQTHLSASATQASEVPRCTGCQGYISYRCTMNARYWRCALCHTRNELPPRYSATVLSNENEAIELVPELSRTVYDVPLDHDAVSPAAYIFVVEGGGDADFLDAMRMAVRRGLEVIEGECLVGVLIYDEELSFVDVRGVLRKVRVGDEVDVVETFATDNWLRKSGEKSRQFIMQTLGKLKSGGGGKRCLGEAVKTAIDMVQGGGLLATRMVVIGSGRCDIGEGLLNGDVESERGWFPRAKTEFYRELGERASVLGVMVDIYVVSGVPVDVGSLSPLAQMSGGKLVMYESGAGGLVEDVWQHLNDPAVVRGMLRVRGGSVGEVYGSGVMRDAEVEEVFRLSCHGHESTLAMEGGGEVVQVAFRGVFLEPGLLPQRVLRVETRSFEETKSLTVLRREVDEDAMVLLKFHQALAGGDEGGIAKGRMILFDWLANLVAKGEGDGGVGKVVFGLITSLLFRQEGVSDDVRAATRCIWEDLSAGLLKVAAYPRLWGFKNLEEKVDEEIEVSIRAVRECGWPIFVLDAFSEVVIYYSGVGNVKFPPPEGCGVLKFRAAIVRERPVMPRFVVCREGTSRDRWFWGGLGTGSFEEFWGGVEDEAREILKREKGENGAN